MNVLSAIRFNLANLWRFRGRDSRARFWPYAAVVLILTIFGTSQIVSAELMRSMERMQQFAAMHPDEASVEDHGGSYSIRIRGFHPEIMPRLDNMAPGLAIILGISIVLLAASVVRRLHDRGRTGAWGLLPLPFLVLGFVFLSKLFKSTTLDPMLFLTAFGSNLAYLGALAVLVVMLAGVGEAGLNRYSAPPPIDRKLIRGS